MGRLGQASELGCDASEQGRTVGGRRQTSGCWAANENRPEEGKAKGKEKKGLTILKRTQANEFKLELEFNRPKAMHQHECNNEFL
jgi:hypothetical protein